MSGLSKAEVSMLIDALYEAEEGRHPGNYTPEPGDESINRVIVDGFRALRQRVEALHERMAPTDHLTIIN